MANNVVFNMTVCILGILILFVHMTNLILKANIDKLHAVAGVLLEKEKIDGEEFDSIFA